MSLTSLRFRDASVVALSIGVGPRRLPYWGMACGIVGLGLVAAALWHWQLGQRLENARTALAQLQAQEATPRPPEPVAAGLPDFARNLPEAASADAVVRDLQRFSVSAGATFVAVDAVPRPATPATLGRVELAVTLRGDYPKVKSVLAQVLDRYPNLLLQRASLRRAGSSADLEAALALVLLTRPTAAPGGGS